MPPEHVPCPFTRQLPFVFPSPESPANRFALAELAHLYTDWQSHPSCRGTADGLGLTALLLNSGQAGETFAILNLPQAGDHICQPSLYGGIYNLFAHTLKKFGISVTFVAALDNLDQ